MNDPLIALAVAVVAGVAVHYICKWMDGQLYVHSQHNKKPGAATPGFFFVHLKSVRSDEHL